MDGRCGWAKSELDIVYHDREWGVPSTDDRHLFEMLILEGAQAGLSWSTILKKRPHYQKVYLGFDPAKVARFTEAKQAKLLADAGIVRNRLKVAASIDNAKAFLKVQDAYGSFADYLWAYVDGQPIQNRFRRLADLQNRFRRLADLPARTDLSDTISKDLKKRGFRFVGSTIIYAYLQAVGVVNDHLVTCPHHEACAKVLQNLKR